MRSILVGVASGLLLLTAVTPADPSPPGALGVARAGIRFSRGGAAAPVRAALRIEGDFVSGLGATPYDPVRDGLRVRVGPIPVLDAADPGTPVRARANRWEEWTGSARTAEGAHVRFRFHPASGTFSVRARGLEGAGLRDAGPEDVPVEVAAGGETHAGLLDFSEEGPRGWTYRAPPPDRREPPPTSGIPPPFPPDASRDNFPLTLFPVAKGTSSGILSEYRRVVRDSWEWADLWKQHAPGKPVPFVDFSQRMVLAYVGGLECPYDRVRVREAWKTGNEIWVWASPEEEFPSAGGSGSPYHFVSVQRYDLVVYF